MVPLALSYDHRVINGVDAGQFMQELKFNGRLLVMTDIFPHILSGFFYAYILIINQRYKEKKEVVNLRKSFQTLHIF